MKKTFLLFIVFLFLGSAFWVAQSPFRSYPGFSYPLIKETVEIAVAPESVFAYLGNSVHAAEWSSFVDHIQPLNPETVPDGQAGSFRRCFKNANENGAQWDEEILLAEPAVRRRLSIFNLQGFRIGSDHLLTEQLYDLLPSGGCRLSLTVFLDSEAGWSDRLKLHFAAYKISSIFKQNLQNIRNIHERSTANRR